MTTAEAPRADGPIPSQLRDAVVRAAGTAHLLVAMDFDGTMAPIVATADAARPLTGAAAAFSALASAPRTTTALISGRALASLRSVASPEPHTLLIGSHGAEVWLGPDAAPLVLDANQAAHLKRVRTVLDGVCASHQGTSLEYKPASIVLHTRQAADDVAASAAAEAHRLLDGTEGIFPSDGKRVVEVAVVHADKGQGIEVLREAAGATAVIFAGDDVTDEHAFTALGPADIGVKVGAGNTAAAFRISGPEAVPALLELVLAARTGTAAAL